MTDEQIPDRPLTEGAQDEKDTSYSPGSEREIRQEQQDPTVPPDVDESKVRSAPGAGGPDDAGDVDIEDAPIHLPGREPAE